MGASIRRWGGQKVFRVVARVFGSGEVVLGSLLSRSRHPEMVHLAGKGLSRRLAPVSHTPSVAVVASSPARQTKVLEMTTQARIRHQPADSQSPSPHAMVLLATQQQRHT